VFDVIVRQIAPHCYPLRHIPDVARGVGKMRVRMVGVATLPASAVATADIVKRGETFGGSQGCRVQ
jgi:hypothetical protein